MKRRDLLHVLGATAALPALGHLSPGERLALGRTLHAGPGIGPRALDPRQAGLVSEIAEMIIPETDTPGARAVGVPDFIDRILADWHTPEERRQFLAGLDAIDTRARESGAGFLRLPVERRTALLAALDGSSGDPGTAEATFRRIKQLTVYGYFTSEAVSTEVLHNEIIPGRFEGCVPLEMR